MNDNTQTIMVRGQRIALTSILARDHNVREGKFKDQEAQVMVTLSEDRILTSRQIHELMSNPPLDISSTRRAITYLKDRGLITIHGTAKCDFSGRHVRTYQIQDLKEQMDLFKADKARSTKRRKKFMVATTAGTNLKSIDVILAVDISEAREQFLAGYDGTDPVMVWPVSKLKAGFSWPPKQIQD